MEKDKKIKKWSQWTVALMIFVFILLVAALVLTIIAYTQDDNKTNKVSAKTDEETVRNIPEKYKSGNSVIDDQHSDILECFKDLEDALNTHFQHEEKMLDDAEHKLPSGHIDIEEDIIDHKEEHAKFIGGLQEMKDFLKRHIIEKDKPHFQHWQ